jgi:2,4-dienoyl-CoA reductase-like NADH-dependent reductase (Old Yellow Enzyme family)
MVVNAMQELTSNQIQETIRDFAHCAAQAKKAGYDGVEVRYLSPRSAVQY